MRKRPSGRRSSAAEFRGRVAIEPTVIAAANRMVLGQTVDWTYPSAHPAMWSQRGLAPQVVELVRRLGPASIRFPGRHAQGYDWTWGIGEHGARPSVRDLRSGRSLPHRFGTDEVLELCAATGARPWFQGGLTATPEDLVGWSRHARAHGTPVWHWELADPKPAASSGPPDAESYAARSAAQLRMLRAEAPEAVVGMPVFPDPKDPWNERMLVDLGEGLDFVAVPLEVRVDEPEGDDLTPEVVRDAMLRTVAAPLVLRDRVRALLGLVQTAVPLREVGVAVTSWGVRVGGPATGWNGTMTAGLATAGCVNALLREPLVAAAHYAAFLEPGPEACLVQDRSGAWPSVHHALLSLYGRHVGTELLAVQITSDVFHTKAGSDDVRVPTLDAVATRSAEGRIAVFLVNRDLEHPRVVELDAEGLDVHARPRSSGVWSGHHLDTNGPAAGASVRALPRAESIGVREGPDVHGDGPWRVQLPACSVVVVEWDPAPEGARRRRRRRGRRR